MIDRDISNLYPPVARFVGSFIDSWNKQYPAHPVQVFEARRSWERQGELYAQGRTVGMSAPKVTKAPAGFSWHQYGLAVDIVFDSDPVRPGLQPTWDSKLPWNLLGDVGKDYSLAWAGDWIGFPEKPHFEKTYGLQITEAHEIAGPEHDVSAVWNALDLTRQVVGRRV